MQETRVRSLGQEDPLEESMATHSSTLPRRISTDRGAWRATVHRVTRVRQDLVTKLLNRMLHDVNRDQNVRAAVSHSSNPTFHTPGLQPRLPAFEGRFGDPLESLCLVGSGANLMVHGLPSLRTLASLPLDPRGLHQPQAAPPQERPAAPTCRTH